MAQDILQHSRYRSLSERGAGILYIQPSYEIFLTSLVRQSLESAVFEMMGIETLTIEIHPLTQTPYEIHQEKMAQQKKQWRQEIEDSEVNQILSKLPGFNAIKGRE